MHQPRINRSSQDACSHLLPLTIGRVWWVASINLAVSLSLVNLVNPVGVLWLHRTTSGSISDRRKMRSCTRSIVLPGGRLCSVVALPIDALASGAAALSVILVFTLRLFFFLSLLPFFADFFEFCMFMLANDANRGTSVHQRIPADKRGVKRYSVNAKQRGSCCVTRLMEQLNLTRYATLRRPKPKIYNIPSGVRFAP